uniref:Uncharacterized protein n=1 Tax=Pyrodinium bahamense TaxID=73915 RepID=A0A7S0B9L1_9DINO
MEAAPRCMGIAAPLQPVSLLEPRPRLCTVASARAARVALAVFGVLLAVLARSWPGLGWVLLAPPAGPDARQVHNRRPSPPSAAGLGAAKRWQPPSRAVGVVRRGNIGGEFGVLPESPSPIIDVSHEEDPLLERLVTVVQAADNRRGIDISAFWIHEGYEIIVIITALSRPQLQAIANAIDYKMRKQLHLKRIRNVYFGEQGIRKEAQAGWSCLVYPRITVHVMTPVQRTYYNIEGTWRDDNKDYEKIPVDELLREDGFGALRLTKELGSSSRSSEGFEGFGVNDGSGAYGDQPEGVNVGSGMDYEADEEDPFWS